MTKLFKTWWHRNPVNCYKLRHFNGDMMFFLFEVNYCTFHTHRCNQNI